MWKINCPLLLNHERTVINHIILESWVKFHLPIPSLITARPVESRNHLNRTCLTKWSMLKEQHIMPRSKEIQEQMRNKIVDMYQSGKGYKAISKALGLQRTMVRAIIHKWRKLGTVVNLSRSGRPTKITPRAQRRLIQEVIKEPRTTSKELQASLASIKVSVHDSTTRKRLGKNDIQRVPRQKKTQRLVSHLPKNMLIIPKTFGQIFCGLMRQKLNFLCPIASGVKPTQHLIKKNIIPTVKHGGSVMVWGCFAASGPGWLAIIDGTMNSALYQKILKENVRPSVSDLKLKRTWIMQ